MPVVVTLPSAGDIAATPPWRPCIELAAFCCCDVRAHAFTFGFLAFAFDFGTLCLHCHDLCSHGAADCLTCCSCSSQLQLGRAPQLWWDVFDDCHKSHGVRHAVRVSCCSSCISHLCSSSWNGVVCPVHCADARGNPPCYIVSVVMCHDIASVCEQAYQTTNLNAVLHCKV